MRFSTLVTYLSFLLPLVSCGKSLYIHKSCTDREGWVRSWDEVQRMAKRAVERMSSNTDYDFAAVLNTVFQTDRDSAEGSYVKSQ